MSQYHKLYTSEDSAVEFCVRSQLGNMKFRKSGISYGVYELTLNS